MNFIKEQIAVIKKNDPSFHNMMEVFLYPSFKVMLYYRIANYLYQNGHYYWARYFSERGKRKTGIEIHPGAKIGKNLFIDHGQGTVIGETAIIGDNVVLFHDVTIGGTGKQTGKRHPTIKDNAYIGSGARILGNIVIGENVKVGANAVVMRDVSDNATVVGVLAREKKNGKKL